MFAGALIMMFYNNWIMALTAIGSSLIGFVLMMLIMKKSQKYFMAQQLGLGEVNGHVEEIYSDTMLLRYITAARKLKG